MNLALQNVFFGQETKTFSAFILLFSDNLCIKTPFEDPEVSRCSQVWLYNQIATIKLTRIPVILSLIIGQVILIGVVDKARRWRSHYVGLTDWHKEVALASGAGRARLIWMRLDRRWREAVQIERKSVAVAVEVVVLRCLLLVLAVLLGFFFDSSKWTRL